MSSSAKNRHQPEQKLSFIQQPWVGSALTILSGLSFLMLCMCLPLVGRAGTAVPHASKNTLAFLVVLLVSLALAAAAVYSKLERRKVDGSPLPYLSIGLGSLCILFLLALVAGLLKI